MGTLTFFGTTYVRKPKLQKLEERQRLRRFQRGGGRGKGIERKEALTSKYTERESIGRVTSRTLSAN